MLVEDHHSDGQIGVFWKPLQLVRWTLTLLIMVFLRDYYVVQIQLLLFLSFIYQIMMLLGKPISDPGDLRIMIFNEIMNSCYLYVNVLLTDFHGYDNNRDNFGWSLVIILGITIGINFTRLCLKTLIWSYLAFSRFKIAFKAALKSSKDSSVAIKPFEPIEIEAYQHHRKSLKT
jgi:hypothetical protein